MGPFAEAYSINGGINPFYLRGDIDGDGKPDYAVWVASKKSQSKGITIYLSSKRHIFVLGAGSMFKINGAGQTNFSFIDTWQVYGRKPVERGVNAKTPPNY